MLYVSEIIGRNKVAVTDTDDGVTEYISESNLFSLVKNGLEVKGVECIDRSLYINAVSVETNKDLAKLSLLKGIQMHISKGVLVGFRILKPLTDRTVIKLSDYCNSIAGYAISNDNIPHSPEDGLLILKLDDKVSFERTSFMNLRERGVIFDLVDCTDDKCISSLYNSLQPKFWTHFTLPKYMYDDRMRYLSNFCMHYVKKPYNYMCDFTSYIFNSSERQYVHDFLLKKYGKDFNNLDPSGYHIEKSKITSRRAFLDAYFYLESKSDTDFRPLIVFMINFTNANMKFIYRITNIVDVLVSDEDDDLLNKYRQFMNDLRKNFKAEYECIKREI